MVILSHHLHMFDIMEDTWALLEKTDDLKDILSLLSHTSSE